MNALANTLTLWLINFHVTATLLLIVGLLATLLVRQPVRRLAVGWATVAGLLLLSVLCAMPQWPRVSWLTLPESSVVDTANHAGEDLASNPSALDPSNVNRFAEIHNRNRAIAQPSGLEPVSPMQNATADPTPLRRQIMPILIRILPWLLVLFAAGVGLVAIWLMVGAIQTLRLRRGASNAPAVLQAELERLIGIHSATHRDSTGPSPVTLLVSSRVAGPIATGVIHPAIIVPSQLTDEATPQGIALVLAHEWAHIRNRDLWLLALGRLLTLVLFAHPLYWWFQRRLRQDQESVADAEVVERASRTDYAKELVNWAQQLHGRPSIYAAALGIWERPSSLTRRIKMILDETRRIHARCSRRWRIASFIAAGMLTLVVSLLTLQPIRSVAADPANPPANSVDNSGSLVVTGTVTGGIDAPNQPESTDTMQSAKAGEVVHVFGTVINAATGKPVSGATVVARRYERSETTPKMLGKMETRSDASGQYQFSVAVNAADMKNGFVVIEASHDDFVPSTIKVFAAKLVKQKGSKPLPFCKIPLFPGEPIQGTVVGPDGKPVEGVEVRILSYPDPRQMTDFRASTVYADEDEVNLVGVGGLGSPVASALPAPTVTDRNGVFYAKIGKGHAAHLELMSKKYAPLTREIHRERGDLGQFKLAKPITLTGRVLDAEGRLLSGIEVSVYPIHTDANMVSGGIATSSKDKDSAADKQKQSDETSKESEKNIGTGTLTISSYCFVNTDSDGPMITDKQGRYNVPRLSPGQYSIMLNMPRRTTISEGDYQLEPLPAAFLQQSVTLAEGESTHSFDIRAVPHVTIAARCVDSAGRPAPGVRLNIHGTLDDNISNTIGRSDAEGRLSVKVPKGLTNAILLLYGGDGFPTKSCRWRQSKDASLRNDQHALLGTLDHDMTDMEIIAYRSPSVVLRVTDENGCPVPKLKAKIVYPEGTLKAFPEIARYRAQTGDAPFVPMPKGILQSIQLLPDQDFTLTVESQTGDYEPRSEKFNLTEGATKKINWKLKKKP